MTPRAFALLLLLLAPALASAKSWQEITPGESSRDDVLRKFGEPSKRVVQGDKEVLAYVAERAIKGTVQAQFMVLKTGKVEQIVVFPKVALDLADVEDNFGRACSAPGEKTPFCYVRQLTDEFQMYFWYKRLGLVVFFNEDRKQVASLVYNSPAPEGASAQVH